MKTYWLFQRSDDGLWDVVGEREWEKIHEVKIIAGSLHLVEARNLALALATKVSTEEVIHRAFVDVEETGNEYAHEKWFSESNDYEDENGGVNKEAASLLSEYIKRF